MDVFKHISVVLGDITTMDVDAIVNAAAPALLGGGGVDGAIHRAAGPGLLQECRKFGGCNHGEARITAGYNLKARHVIHTPGPIYRGGQFGESQILKNSYRNSMLLAKEHGIKSIALPAISAGVYGYPKPEACQIAITTVVDFMKAQQFFIDVVFVLFDQENYQLYVDYLASLKAIPVQ